MSTCRRLTGGSGIAFSKFLTVDGSMYTAGITIHAAANSRIFNITSGNVTLKNLTLTGGDVNGDGGATKRREKAQNAALQTRPLVRELFVPLVTFRGHCFA